MLVQERKTSNEYRDSKRKKQKKKSAERSLGKLGIFCGKRRLGPAGGRKDI